MAAADWDSVARELDEYGCAPLPQLLTPAECARIAGLYDDPGHFRATIDMARHRFGAGEYRYFAAPFPEPVDALRHALYPRLLPVARDWHTRLGRPAEWPDTLDEWLDICHAAYGRPARRRSCCAMRPGGWNALHRDLYGDKGVPAPGRGQPERPGDRPHRWRVPAGRAAATRAVAGHRGADPAWPRARLHHPRPAGRLGTRLVGRPGAPRGVRDPLRPPVHLGLVFHDAT